MAVGNGRDSWCGNLSATNPLSDFKSPTEDRREVVQARKENSGRATDLRWARGGYEEEETREVILLRKRDTYSAYKAKALELSRSYAGPGRVERVRSYDGREERDDRVRPRDSI